MAYQQVGEPQQRSLGRVEQRRITPASRLFEGSDLLGADASPPRRGGMGSRSILTTVANRRSEVSEVLQFLGQLRVGRPERAAELVVRAQYRGLVRKHPKEGSDVAARSERFEDSLDVWTGGTRRNPLPAPPPR